jgi:hypothetical protein
VVPFGVDTTVVVSQSGADFGTRFWKNDLPPAPSGNRCSSTGRSRIVSSNGPATAR